MKRTLVFAIVAGAMWVSSAEVCAINYYVSPSGSNSYPGTFEQPFETIQKAADVVVAGDTVIVRDGVYTDSNTFDSIVYIRFKAGTPGNWITFKSENLYGAVLDGENETRNYGFYLYYNPNGGSQNAYVKIEGFEIKNLALGGINLRSPGNVNISQVKIHGVARNYINYECTSAYSMAGVISKLDTYNITVERSVIYDIGPIPRYPEYGDCCPYDYKRGPLIYAAGFNWNINNNILYNAVWVLTLPRQLPESADVIKAAQVDLYLMWMARVRIG